MTSKRINIVIIAVLLASAQCLAQKVLIEEQPDINKTATNWGPNRKHFIQTTAYTGIFLPVGENLLNLKTAQSQSWGITIQYKRRFSQVFSLVAGATYNSDRFSFDTNQASFINSSQEYSKEYLKLQTVGYNERIRLNLNRRRGNHLGKYIDIGFFSEFLVASKHIGIIPGDENIDNFKSVKTTESGLNYLQPFHYGIIVQFGINNISLYYKGKLTEWFSDTTIAGILPAHQIGINYAIVN